MTHKLLWTSRGLGTLWASFDFWRYTAWAPAKELSAAYKLLVPRALPGLVGLVTF